MKKGYILSFILGIVITVSIGIGVYAISADQITYNDTTVDLAIDDLYDEVTTQKSKFNTLQFPIALESYSTSFDTRAIGSFKFNNYLNKYTYIALKSINSNSNCGTTDYQLFKSDWSVSIRPEVNVKYSLSDYSIFYGYVLSNNSTNSCQSTVIVELSN